MSGPTVLLIIFISTHFLQIVQSDVCTEKEEIESIEMQAEVNIFKYDFKCVTMETLAYDCATACTRAYQELYESLSDCAVPSEPFGYLNLKELYHAFEHLCIEDIGSGNASNFEELEDDWQELIFPTYGSVPINLNEHRLLQLAQGAVSAPIDTSSAVSSSGSSISSATASTVVSTSGSFFGTALASNLPVRFPQSGVSSSISDVIQTSSSSTFEDDSYSFLPGLDYSSSLSSDDSDGSSRHSDKYHSKKDDGPDILIIIIPVLLIGLFLIIGGFWLYDQHKQDMARISAEEAYQRYNVSERTTTATETVSPAVPSSHAQSPSNGANVYDIWSDRELVEKKLNHAEIRDIKVLGSGAFGVVWLVSYYDKHYASKRPARNIVDPSAFETFVDEVKLVARIEHANIIECIGVAWTMRSNFQALFTYASNGDLRDYLQRSTTPRHWTKEKLSIAIDIAEALVYVQSFERPIVHRDLKSRNVLLSEEMIAKVSDFGSARLMSDNNTMTTQAVGTARWLAPEVVAGESYDHTCDSYSFGAILTELDTNELPLHDVTDREGKILPDYALLHRVACRTIKPRVSENCPQAMRDLVDQCLNFVPRERPTAVQISFQLREMMKNRSVLNN